MHNEYMLLYDKLTHENMSDKVFQKEIRGTMASNKDTESLEDITPKSKNTLRTYLTQGTFIVLMTAGVAGFVLGDIGQYMGGGPSSSAIATVGNQAIGFREADDMYQRIMDQYKGMPPELLTMQNPPAKAVENLIEKYAISEYARHYNMRAPKAELSRILNQYQFFKDEVTGKFSKEKLRLFLKRSNISQEDFIADIEDDILRQTIYNLLRRDVHIPSYMADIVAAYTHEKRKIKYASIGWDYFKDLPSFPKDIEKQKEFFETHKVDDIFMRPELRHVEYVAFAPNTMTDIVPTMDVLKAAYQDNMDDYKTEETRKILQLFFDDKDAADSALKKLEKGDDFIPSALDLGFEMENIDLGTINRTSLDKAITSEIFSVKEGEFTQPIANGFGYVIYFSEKVTPSEIRPFESVAGEIKVTLLDKAFKKFVENNSDSLEDDIAGGMSLKEIAEKYNAPFVEFENITDRGVDYLSGQKIIKNNDLIVNIFDASLDDEATYVTLDNGGFIYATIKDIIPKRVMTFEEAQPLLASYFEDKALKKKIAQLYKNINADIEADTDFDTLLDKYDLTHQTESFNRWQSTDKIPSKLMMRLFQAEKNALIASEFKENISEDLVLASVIDVVRSTPTEEEFENVENQISDNVQNSLYKALVQHAKNAVGVDIDLDAYNRFLEENGQ